MIEQNVHVTSVPSIFYRQRESNIHASARLYTMRPEQNRPQRSHSGLDLHNQLNGPDKYVIESGRIADDTTIPTSAKESVWQLSGVPRACDQPRERKIREEISRFKMRLFVTAIKWYAVGDLVFHALSALIEMRIFSLNRKIHSSCHERVWTNVWRCVVLSVSVAESESCGKSDVSSAAHAELYAWLQSTSSTTLWNWCRANHDRSLQRTEIKKGYESCITH